MGWVDNVSRWKLERVRLWNRLIETKDDRLVKQIFLWDLDVYRRTNKSNFVSYVKQICSEVNVQNCFTNKSKIDISHINQKLLENVESKWRTSAISKDKLDIYNQIKSKEYYWIR